MSRSFLLALTVLLTLAGSVCLAEDKVKKDTEATQPTKVTITKIDAKEKEITVKYTDEQGKPQEKTFRLTEEVKLLDETGRVVKLDVFEAGNEAVVIESEGKLQEFRRTPARRTRQFSDSVRTLIEMSDVDNACAEDVQRVYDMLRKLDTKKDGRIDSMALKTEADAILQERVKEIFQRLDANKDGKISKEEARGLIKEHFDKIDANKDGFIDVDELLKAARERQEEKAAERKANDPKPIEKEQKLP